MNLKPLVISLFFLLFFNVGKAQYLKRVFDTGMWSGVGVDYTFLKDFELTFQQDVRLFDAFTKVNKANTDLGLGYKINKNFKLGINARYSYNSIEQHFYRHDFRLNYDLMFKVKIIKNLKFQYRLRFHQVFENYFSAKGYQIEDVVSNLRNKIQFDYTIKDHKIYVNAELFREMQLYRTPHFNKIRVSLGSEWKNKLGEFDYAIAYEKDIGIHHPLHYLFFKTYYTFKFETKKKKKKRKKKKNEN